MDSSGSISQGTEYLRDAARAFFSTRYQSPPMTIDGQVDPTLNWKPSLSFKVNHHLTILVEASEKPYPIIFNMRRVDIENLPMPISIYCVCPEEGYLNDQAEAKKLIADGYGLLTVDGNGVVQLRQAAIPIIQQIHVNQFNDEIKGLPKKLRQRLAESFERYEHNPPSGSADVTEVLEGLVLKAAREAAAKKWIPRASANGLAKALDAMAASKQGATIMAALGAARGYIAEYRNASHHFPRDKKQAAKKYRDCKHAFIDGLKKAQQFRSAVKGIGLSGTL